MVGKKKTTKEKKEKKEGLNNSDKDSGAQSSKSSSSKERVLKKGSVTQEGPVKKRGSGSVKQKSAKKSDDYNKLGKKELIQPLMNIGLVGHVDHGKTTLTERLSGKWTDTHSEEIKRGITIRLGYADTLFYRIPGKKGPEQYTTKALDAETKKPNEPILKISFVDAPGHESLMATMLSGATIMDGALLIIAANEFCPQPQTREHLMALQIAGIEKIVVVQNKIDLVSTDRAKRNYEQIKEFLKDTPYADAPVVPLSAQRGVNIDALIQVMLEVFTVPERDPKAEPLMVVARSFDINKPGVKPEELKGGVLGGALKRGKLRVGDTIEIRPGRIVEEANKLKAKPLKTTITGIITGGKEVEEVIPGGSIAVRTSLDHSVVKGDQLTGSVVGLEGKLPPIWDELLLEAVLLERVVGSHQDLKVQPIAMNEILMLNVNSAATVGIVAELKKGKVRCRLKKQVCASIGARVTISRRIGNRFRLIGYGLIKE